MTARLAAIDLRRNLYLWMVTNFIAAFVLISAVHAAVAPPGPARLARAAEAKRCVSGTRSSPHAASMPCAHQSPTGIWGGLSAEERKDLLRARRRARSVPPPAHRGAGA